MPFSRAALLILGLNIALHAADTRLVRETEALTPAEEQTKLHVPPGFEIQLFASEPMINKPINMAFDARGRLWVSSTVEYPYAADKGRWSDPQGTHVKGSRDAIKILEDTDGDGKADKVTDFANELNIPTGVLPWHKPEHKAGCIAWSIPNIWYFADTDGDDKADHHEILFGPLGYEKDTHGMCSSFRLGLDGWVYATHGFNNTSRIEVRADRWRDDGRMTNSRIPNDERNPNATNPKSSDSSFEPRHSFGIPYSSFDIPGRRLELQSGNVFRFRPDGSKVERYTSGQVNPFGLAWDRYGNLYSADCHSSPIYQLIRGACYPSFGKPHDGLGFAPVMCQHTHGSTGICGIVYIDGGVWGPEWDDHTFVGNVVTSTVNHDHVTFTGSTPKANEQPDFLTSDDPWYRPVDLQLGPDNALYIADFYNKIIGHYEVPLDHPGRDKERGRIWRVVKTTGTSKRQASAIPDLSDWRSALQNPSPFVQRAILAKMLDTPEIEALPLLVGNTQKTPVDDVSLALAYRIAIREHLKLAGAFDRIDTTAHDQIAEIAPAVPTADAAAFLLRRLQNAASITPTILTHIARHGDPVLLPQAIALAKQSTLQNSTPPLPILTALHDGLSERGMPPPSELLAWAQELSTQLLNSTAKQPTPAWTTLGDAKWSLQPRKLANDTETTVLQSMVKGGGEEESRTGTLKSKTFGAPAKLSLWINGHRGFPATKAHEKNLVRVVEAESGRELARAFPPRSDTAKLTVFDLAAHVGKPVRLEVIDGDNGKAYAWLGITGIEPAMVSVNDFESADTTRESLKTLAIMLQHSAPAVLREKLAAYMPPRPAPPPLPVSAEQRKQLDTLIAARVDAYAKAKPDVEVGANVFKMNCATCHQIKGEGGLIGPQLDGIGARGPERLCEDILDPNRNVDAHFHLHMLTLKDGSTLAGFLKAELGQIQLLADATGKEHRIAKKDIAKTEVSPISLMPPTFGQTMDEATFIDLLGYLLNEKAGK
jgi:putative membrane-bound dehydrogenase-like protein